MEPVKIWGTEEVILNYFFQIVQTKHLFAPYFTKCQTEKKTIETIKIEKLPNKGPKIISIVSNNTELLKLAKIIKQFVQAGTELQLFILFCSYDHFFELCLSRGKEEKLQMEQTTLEYEFAIAAGLLINTSIEFKLMLARRFLVSDPLATPKILSVELSKQREQIIQMMTKAVDSNEDDAVVGLITFASPISVVVQEADQKKKKKKTQTPTDAMFTDVGKSPTTFISWVQLPYGVENLDISN